MFCPNCGLKNPDDACFCAKCGARLMYVGKEKCEYLKSIRDRIAKENNTSFNNVVISMNKKVLNEVK